jgi:hypothetical protein
MQPPTTDEAGARARRDRRSATNSVLRKSLNDECRSAACWASAEYWAAMAFSRSSLQGSTTRSCCTLMASLPARSALRRCSVDADSRLESPLTPNARAELIQASRTTAAVSAAAVRVTGPVAQLAPRRWLHVCMRWRPRAPRRNLGVGGVAIKLETLGTELTGERHVKAGAQVRMKRSTLPLVRCGWHKRGRKP